MLRENWRLVSRIERLCDLLIVVAAFFSAYYSRSSLIYWNNYFKWNFLFGNELGPIGDYTPVLIIGIIAYIGALQVLGSYGSMRLSSLLRLVRVAVQSSLITFLVLSSVLFIFKTDLSRSFLALFCLIAALFISLERICVLYLLRLWRRKGRNFRNILICGFGEQAEKLAKEIRSRPELGINIKAFADLSEKVEDENEYKRITNSFQKRFKPERIIHGIEVLESSLKQLAIDEVIFTDIAQVMIKVEEMILICQEEGIRTTLAADLFSLGMVQSNMSYFGGMPLIHYQTPPGERWELYVKRLLDIIFAFISLLLLGPLFLLVAIGVKFSSPGPVLFKQKRVGLNGRLFSLYKFRSMYENAESKLADIIGQNEMSGPAFKIADDPRITPFGKLIRRFSLDELPQLWNVVRGDMSLVGPRPPIPGEVGRYDRKYRRRLSMRPGLTCLWQVNGRNEIRDFEKWVQLDLQYIDNWSLFGDLVLLMRTIPVVFFGGGK